MGEQYEQTRSFGHALLHLIPGSGNVHPPVSGHSVSLHGKQAQTGVTLAACKLQTDCFYSKNGRKRDWQWTAREKYSKKQTL
jgi:hypothetical protein